ncbi:MAG: hypothetical protein M1596_04195, partial [Firmicutes bacterium]|nr:hypothetical protein [Bacillota bacterium]
MKNKWLVGLTIGGAVFLIVPFVLMGIKPTKVAGLILVSHYQTLLVAVLTLAIAMIGFNTYLGLEERISKQVDDLSQQIKKDNIERLRLLFIVDPEIQTIWEAFKCYTGHVMPKQKHYTPTFKAQVTL